MESVIALPSCVGLPVSIRIVKKKLGYIMQSKIDKYLWTFAREDCVHDLNLDLDLDCDHDLDLDLDLDCDLDCDLDRDLLNNILV